MSAHLAVAIGCAASALGAFGVGFAMGGEREWRRCCDRMALRDPNAGWAPPPAPSLPPPADVSAGASVGAAEALPVLDLDGPKS